VTLGWSIESQISITKSIEKEINFKGGASCQILKKDENIFI